MKGARFFIERNQQLFLTKENRKKILNKKKYLTEIGFYFDDISRLRFNFFPTIKHADTEIAVNVMLIYTAHHSKYYNIKRMNKREWRCSH